jgi:hypothetical protein
MKVNMRMCSLYFLLVVALFAPAEMFAQQPSSIPRLNRRMESFYYRQEGKAERRGDGARADEMRRNAEIYGGGSRSSSENTSRYSDYNRPSSTPSYEPPPVRREPDVKMPPMGEIYEVPPDLAGNSLGLGLYSEVGQADWASVLRSLLEAVKGEVWSVGALAAEHNYPLNSSRMPYSKFRDVVIASGLKIHSESDSLSRLEVKDHLAAGRPVIVHVNCSQYGKVFGLVLAVSRAGDQTQIYFPVRANRYLTDGVAKLFPGGAGYSRFMVIEGAK